MINVYKKDGPFLKNGLSYDVKSINKDEIALYLKMGWTPFLDDLFNLKKSKKPTKSESNLTKLATAKKVNDNE